MPPPFRFVHAADIHLDSPLKGLAGQEGETVRLIRSATRRALEALIGRVIEEEAAFLVLAGDIYDGNWRDYHTGLFFVRQMGRLAQAGIPAFLIHGNHDAESQITRRLSLPDNVTVFSSQRPETHIVEHLGVALHGQSFRQRSVTANLARGYPNPVPNALNIGLLHTGLGGEEGHETYAPCTLAELVQKGYDYWALGHIHQADVRHERPYVVYSGNLQGRHIREPGPKGAYLVHVQGGSITALTPFYVDVVRWALLKVSAAGCETIHELFDGVRDAVERAVADQADGRLLACRLEVTGTTRIHDQLLASTDQLLNEAQAAALALGENQAWVERVAVATRPASTGPQASQMGQDVLQILRGSSADLELREQLKTHFDELVRKLPYEVRTQAEDGLLKALVNEDYGSLIQAAEPYLMARLLEERR